MQQKSSKIRSLKKYQTREQDENITCLYTNKQTNRNERKRLVHEIQIFHKWHI